MTSHIMYTGRQPRRWLAALHLASHPGHLPYHVPSHLRPLLLSRTQCNTPADNAGRGHYYSTCQSSSVSLPIEQYNMTEAASCTLHQCSKSHSACISEIIEGFFQRDSGPRLMPLIQWYAGTSPGPAAAMIIAGPQPARHTNAALSWP